MKYCIIVDGYNAGQLFIGALKARGYDKCIHVQSTPILLKPMTLLNISEYTNSLIYEGDIELLINQIMNITGQDNIACVIAGSEPGVEMADILSERIGILTNGTKLSAARRDKFLMREAVKSAGLAVPLYMVSSQLDEITSWIEKNTDYPVVLKPLKSVCTDSVFICSNIHEVEHAYSQIIGRDNLLGMMNDQVLVESFINGVEYVVNSVSCDGKHLLNDIWMYRKRHIPGLGNIYDREELHDFDGKVQQELVVYVHQVLDALGIKFGATHAEVYMTAAGPVLVEVGARVGGATNIAASQECVGHDAINLTIDSYLDHAAFMREMEKKSTLSKYAMVIDLVSEIEGRVVGNTFSEMVGNLPSLRSMVIKIKPGDTIKKTTNLVTSPAKFHLVHIDRAQIERDYEAIQAAGKLAFLLEAPQDKNAVVSQWKNEYEKKGIPSSYRDEPSAPVSQFLYQFYSKRHTTNSVGRVLDMGAGRGRNTLFFAEKGFDVTAIDFVEDNMRQLQAFADSKNLKVKAICGDVTSTLPADDGSIDIVLDIFCYKHQLDERLRSGYRAEVARVLKPDGLYLLSLAGKEDGFYGPLCPRGTRQLVDPYINVGSILYDPEDVITEFSGYRILETQTVRKMGLMHGAQYMRVTHAFIMELENPSKVLHQLNSARYR